MPFAITTRNRARDRDDARSSKPSATGCRGFTSWHIPLETDSRLFWGDDFAERRIQRNDLEWPLKQLLVRVPARPRTNTTRRQGFRSRQVFSYALSLSNMSDWST